MAEGRITAAALVTVTLEIDAASTWGKDCTVTQIHQQAGEETINGLSRVLRDSGHRFRIIGEPKVSTVITKQV